MAIASAMLENARRRRRLQARVAAEVERHPGAILVGHSLESTLIAPLAQWRPDLPVGVARLVAPAR